jgi:hypothetical protein
LDEEQEKEGQLMIGIFGFLTHVKKKKKKINRVADPHSLLLRERHILTEYASQLKQI